MSGATISPNDPAANCPLPGGTNNVVGWKTSPTGVQDMLIDQVGVKIKPNPVVNELIIDFNLDETMSVVLSVMDITGKKVYHEMYAGTKGENQATIAMSSLPAGTYLLQVVVDDKVSVLKVVKQ